MHGQSTVAGKGLTGFTRGNWCDLGHPDVWIGNTSKRPPPTKIWGSKI